MSTPELTEETPERPLRKDAARNRERILAAAGEVFAERGLEVTLDDIARHAGVGVGTVYRRFQDKEQLIDALFEQRIAAIETAAQTALEIDDPWRALEGFLVSTLEQQAQDCGLRAIVFDGQHGRERVARVRARIESLVRDVVVRAHDSGQLRTDVVVEDIRIIQKMVCGVMDMTRGVSQDAWRRYLTLILDGLRPRRDGPTPLPVAALEHDLVDGCMRSTRARRA
jgi:AcrR family transcriptional regulator